MGTRKRSPKFFWIFCSLGAALVVSGCATVSAWKPLVSNGDEMKRVVETAIAEDGQPSAAGALVRADGAAVSAAAGSTRMGGIPVTEKSLYHIGSVTKSMTAVLAAILIEEGRLDYTTTLAAALPGINMRDEYRDRTILDLMLSRAGIIPFQHTDNEDPAVVEALWTDIPAANAGTPRSERAAMTAYALSLPPIYAPGDEAVPVYSNVSWAILGHILEETVGMPYEEALATLVFAPLGIRNYKIGGWPRDDYGADEPVGHYPPEDSAAPAARRPQSEADGYFFPAWMNPAGGVNMDIEGFARYAREQLRGLGGNGSLLPKHAYEKIHSVNAVADSATMYQGAPSGQELSLGLGWGVAETDSGLLSLADGSGGTFYARLVVYPALDIAFAGLANSGDGDKALRRVIKDSTGFELE